MGYKQIKIHYGELSTKGKNRKMFQQKLAEHIRHKTKKIKALKIYSNYDFMFLKWLDTSYEEVIEIIKDIPGIARFEPVYEVEKNMEAIINKGMELFASLETKPDESFKVVAKRSDKNFYLDSIEIQKELGYHISEKYPELEVNMIRPTYKITVQIDQEDSAYLSLNSYKGMQGMPYGSSGKGLLMLSGGFDSPIAGYLMMKRGMEIEAVHFSSPPYTSPQSLEKAKQLTSKLAHFGLPISFINVPFTNIQESIKDNIHENESMTVTRRMMFRIMERLVEIRGGDAIINGESLGQVASQTIKSMRVINDVTSLPIMRPLIALDKNDIIAIAEQVGTYDLSNQPYDDCCTVFAPKSPHTKPKLTKIELLEENIEMEKLIEEAISNVTVELIDEDYFENIENKFKELL